MCIARNP